MSSRSGHHSSSHKTDRDRQRLLRDGSSRGSDDTRSVSSASTTRSGKTARPDPRALVPVSRQYDDDDDIGSVRSYSTSKTSKTGRSAPDEYFADEYSNGGGGGDAGSVYSSRSSRKSRGAPEEDDSMSMRSGVSKQSSAYSGRSHRSQGSGSRRDGDDDGLSTMSDLRESLPDYDGRSGTSGRTGSSGRVSSHHQSGSGKTIRPKKSADDIPFNKIENAVNQGKKISVANNCPRYVVGKDGKERKCTWCNGTGRCSVARKK